MSHEQNSNRRYRLVMKHSTRPGDRFLYDAFLEDMDTGHEILPLRNIEILCSAMEPVVVKAELLIEDVVLREAEKH